MAALFRWAVTGQRGFVVGVASECSRSGRMSAFSGGATTTEMAESSGAEQFVRFLADRWTLVAALRFHSCGAAPGSRRSRGRSSCRAGRPPPSAATAAAARTAAP